MIPICVIKLRTEVNFTVLDANRDNIKNACQKIIEEELVIFPTETVYGLGAIASNNKAIERVYKVKGRPKNNPLIVHAYDVKQVLAITENIPKEAHILIEKYWPGPLTLILPYKKSSNISSINSFNLLIKISKTFFP